MGAAALVLAPAAEAAATTFTVSGFGDAGGSCQVPAGATESCPTLRAAVAAAAAAATPASVPTVELGAGTYELSSSPLSVPAAITIHGAGMGGAGGTTIKQTDGTTEVLDTTAAAGTQVTLEDLEVTGGHNVATVSDANGGGIASTGALALQSVLVTGNTAVGAAAPDKGSEGGSAYGGGVYANGPLLLSESEVTGNTAQGAAGGVAAAGGPGGEGGSGYGGGIEADGPNLTVAGSSITANMAVGGAGRPGKTGGNGGWAQGGGIDGNPPATTDTVTVTDSTISDNVAAAGPEGAGSTTGASGSDAEGGGLIADAVTVIRASTIAGNLVNGSATAGSSSKAGYGTGGGLMETAPTASTTQVLTVVNSTVAGNTAAGGSVAAGGTGSGAEAGGIQVGSPLHATLASDTVVGNEALATGSGLTGDGGNVWGGHVTIAGTIIAAGLASGDASRENCDGSITDDGHNLEDDTAGGCGFTAGSPSDDVLVAPGTTVVATALAGNGGPTQTLALTPSSPALNAGGACLDLSSAGTPPLTVDQRGLPRPATCDIGAFQHQLPAAGTARITGTPAAGRTLTCATTGFTGDGLTFAYSWKRDAKPLTGATGSTYTVAAVDAGHSLSCTASATGTYGGHVSATSAAVAIPLARATISRPSESHRRWRESGKPKHGRPPVGTTFKFTLNESATVTLTFTEPGRGRKVSGKCVPKTARNRKHAACPLAVGTLRQRLKAGSDALAFAGRVGGGHRLKPGSYTVLITAAGPDGHTSPAASLKFTIDP